MNDKDNKGGNMYIPDKEDKKWIKKISKQAIKGAEDFIEHHEGEKMTEEAKELCTVIIAIAILKKAFDIIK